MSKTVFMRGLQNFIQDIRACQNKEQEERRVEKEIAKIRAAFSDDKGMSGYDKRKYVWKLLYIYMMGYKIDFGHKQACDLIPKPKYKDKQVGYMACSILLHENDEFLRLVINGVHMDLVSRNEAFECLALSFIGSVGGTEMVDALVPGILKLLTSGSARPVVKKRAALCLLRMVRKAAPDHPVVHADTFAGTLNDLMEEPDLGLLLATVTLFCGILAKSGPAGYESCQARVIRILDRLTHVRARDIQSEYLYYAIPSPWLQSKCLRALQYFPMPEAQQDKLMLSGVLRSITDNPAAFAEGKAANPNKVNAILCILFEAITLTFHIETDTQVLNSCASALGRLLNSREPNVRYLTLEQLSRMASLPSLAPSLQQYTGAVQTALRDSDSSIRRKAMELQVAMCDPSNVQGLVATLMAQSASEGPMSRDMVAKIGQLAEKHATDLHWYVDTVYQLLERYGDVTPDETWQRLVLAVGAQPAVQQHAARGMVDLLKRGSTHESVACTGAYILGEHGGGIKSEVPCLEQYRLLHRLFPGSSPAAKGLLLTAYVKLLLQEPQNSQLRLDVGAMFEANQKFLTSEQQERIPEAMALSDDPATPAGQITLPMPKFPEHDTSFARNMSIGMAGSAAAAAAAAGGAGGSTQGSFAAGSGRFPDIPSQGAAERDGGAGPSATGDVPMAAPRPSGMSFDLLGEEAILPMGGSSTMEPASSGALPASSSTGPAAATAAAPPAPSPIDLLSDLFGDVVNTAPARGTVMAPALPPAPMGGLGGNPYGAPALGPAPLAGGAAPLLAVPGSNNPFAAAFPGAGAGAGAAPGPFAPLALPAAAGGSLPFPQGPGAGGAPPFGPAGSAPAPLVAPSSNNPFAAAWPPAGAAAPAPFATAPYPYAPAPEPLPAPAPAHGPAPTGPAHTFALGDPFSALTSSALGATPSQASSAQGGHPAHGGQAPGGYPGAPAPSPYAPAPAGFPPATAAGGAPAPAPWGGAPGGPLPESFSSSSGGGGGWGAAAAPAAPTPWDVPAPAPAPAPRSVSVPHFEPAQPLGDLQRWYDSLMYRDRGVLYEDQYMQVGAQTRYAEGKGDVVLYLGNKSTEHGLEQASITASSSASVSAVVDYPVPRNLAPKEQVQVLVKVTCLGPVDDVPTLTLQYQLGAQTVRQALRLPVTNVRFLAPQPGIAKELFFEQWKALGNPPTKSQEMVSRSTPAQSEGIVALLRQVNLGVEHGYLDPSPYNEAGAAEFVYGPAGAEQRVLVMCRVEGNPQNMSQFRVTVVSALPAVSSSLRELIVQRLTSL